MEEIEKAIKETTTLVEVLTKGPIRHDDHTELRQILKNQILILQLLSNKEPDFDSAIA